MSEAKAKKAKSQKKKDKKTNPRAARYYFIEQSGGGVRYFYRARKREESETDVHTSKIENGQKMIKIAWQRYYFDEGELSHPDKFYRISDLIPAPTIPVVNNVSFVQTVGMPERFFDINDKIMCLNPAGRPLAATIRGIEKNYYHVVYGDDKDQTYEWISRNSARLKIGHAMKTKEAKDRNAAARRYSIESELFDVLKEGMYVEAQYPDGEMIRARVLHKEEEPKNPQQGYITVIFIGNRLTRQRAFPRRVVNEERLVRLVEGTERVKVKDNNKTLHFISSLKAINLSVVSMNREGGHSMFRALSYQLFGTQTNWKAIRGMCVDHMINHKVSDERNGSSSGPYDQS